MNQNETFTTVISFAILLMVLGFVSGLVGGMVKGMAGFLSSSSLSSGSQQRQLGNCGKKCRPLFEKAAAAYWGDDPGLAAQRQMEAQTALYRCKGIKPDFETAFGETERWFSFFSLWQPARLIEQSKRDEALGILKDQKESYEEPRAFELGILQDYGATATRELYSLTKYACDSLEGNRITEAIHYAQKAADLQYDLAVERAGTIAPSRRESSKHHSTWLIPEQKKLEAAGIG